MSGGSAGSRCKERDKRDPRGMEVISDRRIKDSDLPYDTFYSPILVSLQLSAYLPCPVGPGESE